MGDKEETGNVNANMPDRKELSVPIPAQLDTLCINASMYEPDMKELSVMIPAQLDTLCINRENQFAVLKPVEEQQQILISLIPLFPKWKAVERKEYKMYCAPASKVETEKVPIEKKSKAKTDETSEKDKAEKKLNEVMQERRIKRKK